MSQRDKYENKNPLHQWILNRFLSRVVGAVSSVSAKTILDLASADGYVIQRLSEKLPGTTFTGVDIDTDALSHARTLNPTSRFQEGNIYTYQHPTPVDLVMALEVFEHLDEVPRALENVARLNSRFFLFSVPHEPYFRTLNFLRGRHTARLGNHPEHVNLWTKKDFKNLIQSRFTIVGDYSSFPWTMFLVKVR